MCIMAKFKSKHPVFSSQSPEVYLGPCQTTMMKLYAKIVSSQKMLIIFPKKSPLHMFVKFLNMPLLPQKKKKKKN